MKVILISGKKRAGKDFIGSLIQRKLEAKGKKVSKVAYADSVKDIICRTFEISRQTLDDLKNNKAEIYIKDTDIVQNPKTSTVFKKISDFRLLLQRFATEGMRAEFGEDVWVDVFKKKAQKLKEQGIDYIIVTDWRFNAEALEDINNVYRIRVKGMYDLDADKHRSETELDTYKNFDYVIDNTKRPPEDEIPLPDFVNETSNE